LENGVTLTEEQDKAPPQDYSVDVSVLVQWRDSAEESTLDARKDAERDRDYYDGKQLTSTEIKALKKRGQPPTIFNRIRRKMNFLGGLEKKQRAIPKALPRNPVDEEDAASITDALRYVIDDQDYARKRSKVWEEMRIEGIGGYSVRVDYDMEYPCVTIERVAWDRMFYDPHSSEGDFSDAKFEGIDIWWDEDDFLEHYKDVENIKEAVTTAYKSTPKSDTYDDKPKSGVWADRKRRRIRSSLMYYKSNGIWHFAEFTQTMMMRGGVSPWLDEDGEPESEFAFQSAYVDRDNNRYGEVRELISPQDAYNKRHSKLLHRTAARQFRYDSTLGATTDIEAIRKELGKVDGVIDASKDALEVLTNGDQSAAEFNLLQITGTELDTIGANSALLGEQGGAPSGKAIQLNQSGGMIELGDLFDGLRHLDVRVFRKVWNRIRQSWTAEKWVRVTDDERSVRFVGYNVDPMQQMMMQYQNGGQMPENVSVLGRQLGELDVDIIIEDAPEGIAPQMEQFQALVELKKADAQDKIPLELLIETMPNLRNRGKILDMIEERSKPAPMQVEMQMRAAQAEIEKNESGAFKDQTQGQLNLAKIQQGEMEAFAKLLTAQQPPEQPQEMAY